MKSSFSLPLFSLLLFIIHSCYAEFTGCGGFIKTSAALSASLDGPLDYSIISVNLFTSEGVLKDSVSCAPNGYYFIPVYDRGSYYLSVEGPQGWTFDTKIHRVQISEATPLCNNDEDLDFFVSGFSLSGWIVGESGPRCPEPVRSDAVIARVEEESYGPSGVIVQVTRVGDDNFEAQTTMTGEGGLYVFPKMLPGSYLLTASHPTWSISPQQVTATMTDENSKVKESFLVSGYDVRARVISSGGGDPISGVEFTLYSYSSESSSSSIKNAGESFSKSRSDDGGRAVFTNIPRGCFLLVPSFADQATFFEFQPTSLQIEVGHGSVVIDNPFKVVGFNMYGRVSHKNGDPIEDVEILVGGEPSAKTDADGFYMVEKMTTGTFDIVAKKDHISFSALSQYPVTANEPSLPEINAEGYDVCGEVVVPTLPGSISRPKTIKIAVSSQDNYNQKFETRSSTSNVYPFCVHLPLSDSPYTLSPLLPRVLAEAGIMFTNEHHTVHVTNSPVFGLSFSQFLPSLSGHVQCIGSCPDSLRVIASAGDVVEEVKVSSKGDYLIEKMFPGSYSVRVSELEGSTPWCWEQREKQTVVGRKKASDVDFVQKGFSLGIVSSVTGGSVVAKAKGTKKQKETFSVTKGKEIHCLAKQGRYDFEVEGCYRLSQESLFLDTSLPIPSTKKGGVPREGQSAGGFESVDGIPTLIFNPVASLVQGEIEVAGEGNVDVFVKISKAGSSSDFLEKVKASPGKTKDGVTTYKYKYWNEKSQRELLLVPEISSSSMLFYPSEATVSLRRELECNAAVPVFSARRGMFVEGVVNPDMAGILVDILNTKTLERVTTVTTKAGGVYSAGPLDDTVEYEAFVFLDGYHLEKDPEDSHIFFARQLASVKVSVVDSSLNTPIDGVLLSLSGKGYRQNNKTNDEGFIEFLNLSPGAYFLKPMLKEYIFEPRQLSLEIEEGSQHPVVISAVRLEYSCYGRVTSLNNQPLGRVVIEAKADDDHEETQTDANGNYRLRGMVPGKQYSVSLKNTNSEGDNEEKEKYEIKNSVPADVSILAEKKDIRNLNFIAYGRSGLGSLTGTVEVEEAFASSIKLEVFKAAGSALKLVKEVPIRAVKFFEVPNLPLGTYVIKMTSSLPSNQFRYSDVKKTVEFTEGDVVQHVELKMDIMLEDDFTDGTVLPYPFLFVLLFGIYCAFNRQKVSDFMKNPRSLIEEKSSEMSSFIPHHIQNFSKKKQQQGKKGKK